LMKTGYPCALSYKIRHKNVKVLLLFKNQCAVVYGSFAGSQM